MGIRYANGKSSRVIMTLMTERKQEKQMNLILTLKIRMVMIIINGKQE